MMITIRLMMQMIAPIGFTNWSSLQHKAWDYDNDGCHDLVEDDDDDNDNIPDLSDSVPSIGIPSIAHSSRIGQTMIMTAVKISSEDLDDDNDGVLDLQDHWPFDQQAYGNDTDMDGLPDRIYSQNITEVSLKLQHLVC